MLCFVCLQEPATSLSMNDVMRDVDSVLCVLVGPDDMLTGRLPREQAVLSSHTYNSSLPPLVCVRPAAPVCTHTALHAGY